MPFYSLLFKTFSCAFEVATTVKNENNRAPFGGLKSNHQTKNCSQIFDVYAHTNLHLMRTYNETKTCARARESIRRVCYLQATCSSVLARVFVRRFETVYWRECVDERVRADHTLATICVRTHTFGRTRADLKLKNGD